MRTVNKDPMRLRLMPHVFKYVGFTVAAAVVISFILTLWGVIPRPIVKIYFAPAFPVGLLIAAMSKDRSEDELVLALRFRAIFFAFFTGITLPFTFILVSSLEISSMHLVTQMIFSYHFMFWWLKRYVKKQLLK